MEVEEETEQFPHQEEELPLPVAPLVALEVLFTMFLSGNWPAKVS